MEYVLSERNSASNNGLKRSLWETDALLGAASRLEQLVVLDGELCAEKLSSLAHLVSNTCTSDRVVQLHNGSGVCLETHIVRLVWEVDSVEPLDKSAQLPAAALGELLAHSYTLRVSCTLAVLVFAESEHSEGASAEPEWAALLLARSTRSFRRASTRWTRCFAGASCASRVCSRTSPNITHSTMPIASLTRTRATRRCVYHSCRCH